MFLVAELITDLIPVVCDIVHALPPEVAQRRDDVDEGEGVRNLLADVHVQRDHVIARVVAGLLQENRVVEHSGLCGDFLDLGL